MAIVTCPGCDTKNRVDDNRAQRQQPVCGRCGAPLQTTATATPARDNASNDAATVSVTDATFQCDVLDVRGKPILVDFWAAWCGPCRMLAPTLDQLASESNGHFVIAKLNVDENPLTAQRYNISSIPAMLIFKDGRLVDQVVGLAQKQTIAATLARHR